MFSNTNHNLQETKRFFILATFQASSSPSPISPLTQTRWVCRSSREPSSSPSSGSPTPSRASPVASRATCPGSTHFCSTTAHWSWLASQRSSSPFVAPSSRSVCRALCSVVASVSGLARERRVTVYNTRVCSCSGFCVSALHPHGRADGSRTTDERVRPRHDVPRSLDIHRRTGSRCVLARLKLACVNVS